MLLRIAFTLWAISILCVDAIAQKPQRTSQISTRELQSDIQIIGPLGVPLGKLVTVEGVA